MTVHWDINPAVGDKTCAQASAQVAMSAPGNNGRVEMVTPQWRECHGDADSRVSSSVSRYENGVVHVPTNLAGLKDAPF